ncbi:MAG: hypothetical protein J6I76_09195 [Oribacterium sp.]|nr:hypothetical protein [Oribacterium sp.]
MANASLPPLTVKWDDIALGEAALFTAKGIESVFDPMTRRSGKDTLVKVNYARITYPWRDEGNPKGKENEKEPSLDPTKKSLDPSAPTHYVLAGDKLHTKIEEEFAKNHVQCSIVQYMIPDKNMEGKFNAVYVYYPDKEDTEKTRQIVNDINLARTSNFNEIEPNKLAEFCDKMGREVALHKNISELEYEQMSSRGIGFMHTVIKNRDGSVTLAFPNDPVVVNEENRVYNESHIFLSGQTGRCITSLEKEFNDSCKSVMAHIANNMEKTIVVDTMHPNRYLVADADSVKFYVRTPEMDIQERDIPRNSNMSNAFQLDVYAGLKAYGQFEIVEQKDLEEKLLEVRKEHEREEVDARVKMIAYKEQLLPMTKQLVEFISMARLEEDRNAVRDIIEQSVRNGSFANLSVYLDKDAKIGYAMSEPSVQETVETGDRSLNVERISERDIREIRDRLSEETIQTGKDMYEQYFSEYDLSDDVRKHLETWFSSEPAVQLLSQEADDIKNVISYDICTTVDNCASEHSDVIEKVDTREFDEFVRETEDVIISFNDSPDQEREEEEFDYGE